MRCTTQLRAENTALNPFRKNNTIAPETPILLCRTHLLPKSFDTPLRQQLNPTAAMHRQAAFEAAEFLMDYLKTKAPFWKRELRASGEHWVEARESDEKAAGRWCT